MHTRRGRENRWILTLGKLVLLMLAGMGFASMAGCRSAMDHRETADETAYDTIAAEQIESFGEESPFTIDRPSDTLRRRLIEGQDLPHKGSAYLGSDRLEPGRHWPDPDYLTPHRGEGSFLSLPPDGALQLTLLDALRIGAANSFDYQRRKEDIFRAALDLDLARDGFRSTFRSQVDHLSRKDTSTGTEVRGQLAGADLNLGKALKSGARLTAAIAVDLANLLTMGGASSLGLVGDASISIPLLRGAGRHIAAEPLTQAEQNVIYAMRVFERFKRIFAVTIASSYLAVLQQQDGIKNSEENYRSLITSARRERRRADAGRQTEIQVDQAVQNELQARDNWIRATETYRRRMDSFKVLLGLPPDAEIELSRAEMDRLRKDYGDRFSADDTVDVSPSVGGEETLSESDQRRVEALKVLLGLPPDTQIELSRTEIDRIAKDYGDRFPAGDTDAVPPSAEGGENGTGVSRLRSVSVTPLTEGVKITIMVDGVVDTYSAFALEDPARIVFDLPRMKSPFGKVQTIAAGSKWASRVRHYGHPDKVRLVIDTQEAYLSAYSAQPSSDGLDIYVGAADHAEAKPTDGAVVDESIELTPPDREHAGPLEIDPEEAITVALANRLDLLTAYDRVWDAQRGVLVLADRLGAELSFLGSASFGEGRSITGAGRDDATLDSSRGIYTGLLTLNLPLERTSERNAYRKGLIDMERAIREAQKLEDQIKLNIRNRLRDLLESRESLGIQTRAVRLAQKRVRNTRLLLEAGRAQIRDLLEAQSALLSTQNLLTAAVVNYRVAELSLQSDMGVLVVDGRGLWREYSPEEAEYAEE